MRKWMLRICILFVFSVLFLNLPGVTIAEDCQDPSGPGTPTSVGNVIIPPCWNSTGAPPTIVASSDTIAAGGSITLWVDSGGLASPPYTWAVSGTGYTLSDTETEDDLETLTLSCTTGSCGDNYDVNCTVTVTDDCGTEVSVTIRNISGEWGENIYECGLNSFNVNYAYKIIGSKRFFIRYGIGDEIAVFESCSFGMTCLGTGGSGLENLLIYQQINNEQLGIEARIVVVPDGPCNTVIPIDGTYYTDGHGFGYNEWSCPVE